MRIAEISLTEGKPAEATVEKKPTEEGKDAKPAEAKPTESTGDKADDAKK